MGSQTRRGFPPVLADQVGGDRVRENCAFRLTAVPVLAGLLLYRLDTIKLEAEEPALYAQIRDYLSDEVRLGCVIRTNNDSNSDMLMDPAHVRRARGVFERMLSLGIAVLPALLGPQQAGIHGRPQAAGRRSIAKMTVLPAEITVKPRCR